MRLSFQEARHLSDCETNTYAFQFEPNPDWSSFHATGPEILEYIRRTTVKYDLNRDIKFESMVIDSVWTDAANKWEITVDQTGVIIEDEADILVNACGWVKFIVRTSDVTF